MVKAAFFAGKFAQGFFSKTAPLTLVKQSIPFLLETASLTTQAFVLTKLSMTLSNTNKVAAEEKTTQDESTYSKLNM
ncbi:Uncharacterised protein [Legionella busanensis]|uniref:Uncharacterized protein n=1 Tax=Legionella busanensis TaxID=190655 RepID=A0A378JR21_9GAMM|nr:hypothetical protein [Legionella busanensis]STX50562.1 Uncharacterised protein [Legionella busanensis]